MTETFTEIRPSDTLRADGVFALGCAYHPFWTCLVALQLLGCSQLTAAQQGKSTCTKAGPYLRSAQTALDANDSATALEKLGQAVEIDPNCPDAHLLLGLTQFQHGDVGKSIQHYQQALKLDHGSYSAHYDLALAYVKSKKLQLARQELEQAVALDPKQPNAAYDLGVVLLELGQPAAAIPHLRHAHAITPDRPDVSFNIVRAELEAGRFAEARQAAQHAPSHLTSDFQWNAAIGQEFFKHGQSKDALDYLRAANGIRPTDEIVRTQLATVYLASGQPEQVLDLIKDPKTATDHYLRGSAFYQAHRFPEADEESDTALGLDPENPKIMVLRVRLLQRAGQQNAAVELAQKATKLTPSWDQPFYLAGISYYFLRHYTEAHQSLARAFELNPKAATAVFMAALASANEGKPQVAERYLRRAISLQPDNARFHCHLGILFMRQNEYAKAERPLKRASQLKPDYALPHYELGKFWAYSNQWNEARREFEAAITTDPGFTSAYYHLARVYTRLGENEKSQTTLANFRRLHKQETDDAAAVEDDAKGESDLQ